MLHLKKITFFLFLLCAVTAWAEGYRDHLQGLVFDVEEWTTPKAWEVDKVNPDKWQIWTKEEDVINKRSNGASITTPPLPRDKDRETPEDGAPVLHTKITGIPNGLYSVYVGPAQRPMAFSLDEGKTWERFDRGETNLGVFRIEDGSFEIWVDDRFASPDSPGWAYYDYIRMMPAEDFPEISNVEAFTLPDGSTQISWLTTYPTPAAEVVIDGKSYPEIESGMRNHQVKISDLEKGKKYTASVQFAVNRKGSVTKETLDFTAGEVPVPATTQETSVVLTVKEPTDRPRADWPLTSGVPFPKGVLASAENVKLFDENGQEVPAQFEKFADWEDGSVKWLTVIFRATTRAKSEKPVQYTLKTSASFKSEPGVSAVPEDEMKAFGKSLSSKVVFADGTQTAARPTEFLLIQQGAQAATIYGDDASSVVSKADQTTQDASSPQHNFLTGYEITFFGNDFIRVRATLGNREMENPHTLVKSATITVPGGKCTPSVSVLQDKEKHATVSNGGETSEVEHFNGEVVTNDGTFWFRDFWQTWPKGLTCGDGTVNFQILPELPEGYAEKESQDFDEIMMHYYWLKDGAYQFKRGMELRHDFWVVKPGRETSAEWLQNPLFAVADPEYYCGTGVFPPVHPVREGKWDRYEYALRKSFAQLEEGRQLRGEYGWMNFGDWFGERKYNWGNCEYDLAYVCALSFCRAGNTDWLMRGVEAARHYTTVDHKKYLWDPKMRELQYCHCYGHVNYFFTEDDPRVAKLLENVEYGGEFRWESDGSGGHTFTPGLYYIACLTGDRYIWDAAYETCWNQATRYTSNFNFSIERAAGWCINNAAYSHRFTHNPYFLNAARLYVECVLNKQNPETGCFDLPQDQTECDCPDKKNHRGGKAFAVGILTHSLIRAAEELPEGEEREKIKHSIVRCADWLLDYSWNEEKKGFRYKTGCPKYENHGWYCILVTEGIAFAGKETGNPRYIDFLRRTMPDYLDRSCGTGRACGKDFTQHHRQIPHALYYLDEE